MDPYETKISDVLATSDFLQRHPAATQLGSDLYSSASNSVSELIQRQRYSGQYVSNATNLQFGSQSSFFIQPGSVVNGLTINGRVTLPRYSRATDLWALHAIESVELNISGSSSVQSLKINGRSHIEYILASLSSTKMEALKEANPYLRLDAAGDQVYFSIPLHLFFSSAELCSVFPLDTATLWKPNYKVFTGDQVNAVVLPNQFDLLYLRVFDQVKISSEFSLANQLRQDNSMVYSIPGTYLQSYLEPVTVGALFPTEQQTNLTSMPSGQLQAILLSLEYDGWTGIASTQQLIQPFVNFGSLRVLYNGIELLRCDSPAEIAMHQSTCTDEDNGMCLRWKGDNVIDIATRTPVEYKTNPVVCIPFAHEVSRVFRERRHESTKDYSGSSIQVYWSVAPSIKYTSDGSPVTPLQFTNQTGAYRINFTFVNAGLYEIGQQTVSLEM
jgi:hypothetical protein